MKRRVFLASVLFIPTVAAIVAAVDVPAVDTASDAPRPGDTIIIVRPAPRTVITTNSLVLEAEAHAADGDSVVAMEFRGGYVSGGYDTASSEGFHQIVYDKLLYVDSTPPFQWIWDLRAVQDHYHHRMFVHFIARTRSGRTFARTTDDFAVDRNPAVDEQNVLVSVRGRNGAGLDTSGPAQEFLNSDNRVRFWSWWTDDSLFLLFIVQDRSVIPAVPVAEALASGRPQSEWWYGDDIEFFLETDHARAVFLDTAHQFQAVLHPDGKGYLGHNSLMDAWRAPLPVGAVRTSEGYGLRVAVPWSGLGVKPAPGLAMGFEAANIDLDKRGGLYSLGTWMGLHMGSHHNASEWGTLRLEGRQGSAAWAWVTVAVILSIAMGGVAGGIRLMRRRKDPASPMGSADPDGPSAESGVRHAQSRSATGAAYSGNRTVDLTRASAVTRSALELVNQQYKDENLNLDFVARRLSRNPKYLSTLFKEDTGMNFNRYLNKVRLEKADQFLRTTAMPISDIGFEVGYGSFKYFSTVYKKYYGITPSQAREQSQARPA